MGDPKDPENLSETPISPPQGTDTIMGQRSDITATARWHLVQERASEAIAELLLLFFLIILLVVRPVRSFVEHFDHFDHETVLPCLAQEDPASLAALISTGPTVAPLISRPAIPTTSKTPVAIPIPTPATAPTTASEKKSSIRPIISLNPLKIVPSKPQSTSTQKPLKPALSRRFQMIGPIEITPLFNQSSSSNPSPTSSESLSESPSDPSSQSSSDPSSESLSESLSSSGSSSLFGSLFSSESSSESTSSSSEPSSFEPSSSDSLESSESSSPSSSESSSSSSPPIIQLPSMSKVQDMTLQEFFEATGQEHLVRLYEQGQEYLRKARRCFEDMLEQIDSSTLLPTSASLPASPSSPYVPPHLRQASIPSASPAVPSVGPPFVTHVSIVKGCFYCHNKYVDADGLFVRHKHRNKCPWFQHHLAVGTCHLNDVGELCLGPKLVGRQATPLPFWNAKISQGEQVKRRTDGTEYDEVLSNRLRNPIVFRH